MTLPPILNQSHKGWVLKIAKVPLQISFKHSEPFSEFLVNFRPKIFTWDNTFCFVLYWNLMQEKLQKLSGIQGEESMIWKKMSCYIQPSNLFSALDRKGIVTMITVMVYISLVYICFVSWNWGFETKDPLLPNPLLISTGFLKYPFRHSFQTGIKIQL